MCRHICILNECVYPYNILPTQTAAGFEHCTHMAEGCVMTDLSGKPPRFTKSIDPDILPWSGLGVFGLPISHVRVWEGSAFRMDGQREGGRERNRHHL